MSYDLNKNCEACGVMIPDDYNNLLCDSCYSAQSKEREIKKEEQKEEVVSTPQTIMPANEYGISDPSYKENPEADDKDQALANLAQFVYSKKMLWYPTRNMYNFIKNYCIQRIVHHPQYEDGKYIWKPKIVDVGCGCGVGTNVLSNEGDFTWGIDKNDLSIAFAKECFTRDKNGIYYAAEVKFDSFDVMKDTREIARIFDIVAAIEIIEHVHDTIEFIKSLTRFAKKDKRGSYVMSDATEFFISTPNRNNEKIKKDQPQNPFHVREWTAQEFEILMKKYFQDVRLLNQKGEPILNDSHETPIIAHCRVPLL